MCDGDPIGRVGWVLLLVLVVLVFPCLGPDLPRIDCPDPPCVQLEILTSKENLLGSQGRWGIAYGVELCPSISLVLASGWRDVIMLPFLVHLEPDTIGCAHLLDPPS